MAKCIKKMIPIQFLAVLLAAFILFPAYSQVSEPRYLDFTYTCYLTGIPQNTNRVDIWIPIPVSDDRQTVQLLSVSEAGGSFSTEPKYGNKIFYMRYRPKVEEKGDTVKIIFSYKVILREKTVLEAKKLAQLPNIKPGEGFRVYLQDNRLIPLDGPIIKLRDDMDLPGMPIAAAKKIYENLISMMVYNYKAQGAGLGDAIWACNSKTGDCSDYHSIFIGICRSAGIPADHEFGIPLRASRPNHIIKDWHCWAKFWVEGPGWITIDASEADKHPELKEYLFGTLSNDYLTISHGRDVNMMPRQQGGPLNIFADPYAEIEGKPFSGIKWIGGFREEIKPR